MTYNQFTLSDARNKLGLTIHQGTSLFSDVPSIEVSDHLWLTLNENIPLALNINTVKARSSMLVTPVLIEARKLLHRTVSIFAGVSFEVDDALDLTGECDFLISNSPNQLFVKAPVITVVEAQNDNVQHALGPCIAKMYAAQKTYQGNPPDNIMGITTTGDNWKFLILADDNVFVDYEEYHIRDVGKIVGIMVAHLRKTIRK